MQLAISYRKQCFVFTNIVIGTFEAVSVTFEISIANPDFLQCVAIGTIPKLDVLIRYTTPCN